MGTNAIVCVFNLFMYFHIFRLLDWKLKFWIISEMFRLVIIATLMVSYVVAE